MARRSVMDFYRFAVLMRGLPPIHEERHFDDLEAAKQEATRLLGHSIFDVVGDFWEQGECRVTVSDAAGLFLFEVIAITVEAPVLSEAKRAASG